MSGETILQIIPANGRWYVRDYIEERDGRKTAFYARVPYWVLAEEITPYGNVRCIYPGAPNDVGGYLEGDAIEFEDMTQAQKDLIAPAPPGSAPWEGL